MSAGEVRKVGAGTGGGDGGGGGGGSRVHSEEADEGTVNKLLSGWAYSKGLTTYSTHQSRYERGLNLSQTSKLPASASLPQEWTFYKCYS